MLIVHICTLSRSRPSHANLWHMTIINFDLTSWTWYRGHCKSGHNGMLGEKASMPKG